MKMSFLLKGKENDDDQQCINQEKLTFLIKQAALLALKEQKLLSELQYRIAERTLWKQYNKAIFVDGENTYG